MANTYVKIMLQSLEKKEKILDNIILLNQRQRDGLEDPLFSSDEFDEIVEGKSKLIDQLLQLDSGFEKIFERMKEELEVKREAYADEIKSMQALIKSITDKSVQIQAQEARNKNLMIQKFESIKQQAKSVRVGGKALEQYRQNMTGVNLVDPQFMDNKH